MPVVQNHDVAGLARRMIRFAVEVHKAVSSGVFDMNAFDRTRLISYLNALRAYRDWVVAQPALDLPESSPENIVLEDWPDFALAENESTNDVLRLLKHAFVELTNSQSARNPAGLISFDVGRLTALIDKCEAFVADYVQETQPVDVPESSPKRLSTGVGRTGTAGGA